MRRFLIVLLCCLGLAAVAVAPQASASPNPQPTASSTPPRPDVRPAPSVKQKPAPGVQPMTSGCPTGYVCIYQGDVWDGSPNHPMVYSFYYYGTYNVSNLIGDYTVFNCQSGGAGVAGYSGYNATGSVLWSLGNNCAGGFWEDLTPTNSVRLYP